MRKLHYFNPENDIALAAGVKNFTPPKAALALRSAGEMLPLWYGERGDEILAHGVNAEWLQSIEERFATGIELYDHSTADQLSAVPWGWSLAAKGLYEREGFPLERLPEDRMIECWRELSHRRTASLLRERIASELDFEIAPAAVEIRTIGDLEHLLSTQPDSMIKSPWSSSGRGLTDTRQLSSQEVIRRSEGIMRKQGSVMVEPFYNRLADFALLFECKENCCTFTGYSLFKTDQSGNYNGNILAPDNRLLEKIDRLYPAEHIIAAGEALRKSIELYIAPKYSGPLGVDMLVAQMADCTKILDATVELNLRMTMGFVAHSLSNKYLAEGSEGTYSVLPANKIPVSDNIIVENRKMISGRINLTPPGGLFSFLAEVKRL